MAARKVFADMYPEFYAYLMSEHHYAFRPQYVPDMPPFKHVEGVNTPPPEWNTASRKVGRPFNTQHPQALKIYANIIAESLQHMSL